MQGGQLMLIKYLYCMANNQHQMHPQNSLKTYTFQLMQKFLRELPNKQIQPSRSFWDIVAGANQLDEEFNEGIWEVIKTSQERIFDTKPSQLVDTISKELGYNLREISKGNKQTH